MKTPVALIATLALLAACEARIGKDDTAADTNSAADVSPEGKAEEGQVSIKAPGFDLKLDIPDEISADTDKDSEIFYPGAKVSGLHIEGNRGGGGVELAFTTADAPDKVAAWYRDPARAQAFAVASAVREGDGYRIEATQKDDGDPFTVKIAPRGTGTDGRLIFRDRN